ncbi:MAG: phosphatidylserine decarboxylase family protein [Prevotella shahii]|jgi:phosphatidylserine decarboxylase|uniref:Phosphatidylserine decarboxylase proenzyme n=1 Tax=Hoylesella shahii DSM 15611 = JCM 12083 TaxID=1122991 RepID=A0A318I2E5_9BACT|nr:phosphatidylserine decarboxylase family protein [Hoylesella shahii]MBF1576098.1 phosphatidylserine decarboxylase family protein [Hoylesella shahii]MBF1591320.1 phosphatidylserine decarboxylase family protein [Hoylesella shahii]PXX24813.1 phosphatidylserine decarboxylase [Hoylesella shahii DSM 15611 = JCM 12083]
MVNKIKKLKKLKKIRIHREGTETLLLGGVILIVVASLLWMLFECKVAFWSFLVIYGIAYGIIINFFRCPIRVFNGETEKVVVAPADGKIVVIEEVDENTYFHDRRIMVSIFMSLFNVHANWFPVDGKVKMVEHKDGNFHKAWLPKASEENEHADVVITTPEGVDILCRQIAGAMARRIVTYAKPDEDCYIDEHLGFIKLGSRVDVFLPLGTEICVKMGQLTTGDQTVLAKLK